MPLAVATDCDQYLHDRLTLLETQLATVNRMALANELPDAIITESGLKITPLDAAVPDTAQALIDQTAMILPHVKITELLLEVDEWTGFTRHFAHLKSGDWPGQKPVADHDPRRRDQPGPDQDGGIVPRHDLRQAGWLQAGTSATNLRGGTGRSWSTRSSDIPSPGIGATAPRHRRTARTSAPAARPRAPATSIRNTAAARGGRSTPISPTSTRRSTPRS